MSSFNKVILMGRIVRDIEVRYSASNTPIGSFGIAVNETWKDAGGQKQEAVTFVDCDCFGKTAETMKQYLSKGSSVLVEGRLRLDQWEDKNGGGKRSKLKVVVDRFTFVGGKKDDAPTGRPETVHNQRQPQPEGAPLPFDDQPF